MRGTAGAALEAIRRFFAHGGPDRAAALAFYGLFSLFPLLLLVAAAVAYALPAEVASRAATELALAYAPWARSLIQANVDAIFAARRSLGVIGMAGLAWSASHVFTVLARALDDIWPPRRRRGFWRQRLAGVLSAGVAAAVLFASLVAATVLAVADHGGGDAGLPGAGRPGLLALLGRVLPVALGLIAVAGVYRLVPSDPPALADALPGAVAAVALLHLARSGFAIYVAGLSRQQLVYGTVTAAILALAWLYVTFAVLLVGAEFAAALSARRRDSRSGR